MNLLDCNETELLAFARKQGLGRLKRGIDKKILVAIVEGVMSATKEHMSDTNDTRKSLEQFIEKNWSKVRSQLPGCDGKCTTFNCTEGRHALCFTPNQQAVMK